MNIQLIHYINSNFIKAFYIVGGFLLFIVGVGQISQVLYLQNGEQTEGLWVGQGVDLHNISKIVGIIFGTIEILAGCIGILGLIKKIKQFILIFNIQSTILGFASLIMAITTLILSKELTDKECGAQSSLANYYTVGSYGETLLCSESCPCYITDRAFNQFDKETQDRIKNFMTQDKNLGYINAQSCPDFQKNLIEQGISIQDGEQIVYHLNRFEQTMKCTAWCNKMEFQNYFFTDINRGPILSGKGCYQMMEKFYWNFSIRFSLFNWMVAGLMFLNIIFTCLYLKHRQIKNDRKISIKAGLFRKLTIFDDEEEDRKQKLM